MIRVLLPVVGLGVVILLLGVWLDLDWLRTVAGSWIGAAIGIAGTSMALATLERRREQKESKDFETKWADEEMKDFDSNYPY